METAQIGFMVKHTLGKASGGTFNLESDLHHLEVHFGGSSSFYPSQETLVGRLQANVGMMQAGIPAVGSFQVDQVIPGFVKVVAVDATGNRSSSSAAVACTPRLLKDEYIDSLTVSKLTAGTLTANTILGAAIRTAETGARVELSASGLRAYDAAGSQTFDVDSGTGEVTLGQPGQGIVIEPGTSPRFDMKPASDDDHFARLEGFYFGESVGAELSVRRTADDFLDGGKVLLWEDAAVISHQPAAGAELYIGLGWPSEDVFNMQGKFLNNGVWAPFPDDAIFAAEIHTGAGFTSWTHTYGTTGSSTRLPIVNVYNGGGVVSWCLTAYSTTAFTVSWSGTADKWITAWGVRI